jgi:hypothetical protein
VRKGFDLLIALDWVLVGDANLKSGRAREFDR